MKSFKSRLLHGSVIVAMAIFLEPLHVSTVKAVQFMYDLEAGSDIPGQVGGKTAITSGGNVTISIYGLFQGSSSTASGEAIRHAQSMFRSSNGGLLGDLSASLSSNFNSVASHDGVHNDLDGDGDIDIGQTTATITNEFAAISDPFTDYGFGTGNGAASGTVSAATIGQSGNDWVYALLGTLTFSPTAPVPGQTTTVTMNRFSAGTIVGADQAYDNGTVYTWVGNGGTLPSVIEAPGVVITAVPEPSTFILAAIASIGLAALRVRRRVQ